MLDDPVALMILGDTEAQALHDNIDRFREPASIGMRSSVIVRSPLADDVWRDAVERGIHLYVVLGAGLDISAFCHPDTPARIFEVNLPTTQEWKRPRLREAAIAVPPPRCTSCRSTSKASGWRKAADSDRRSHRSAR
nr:class I SAM-dependent methyltransferase [Burkholderia multivorans]